MIIEVSIRIALLAVAGWIATACLKRRAAARHAVWTAVLAGMMLMPVLYTLFPRLPVRVLPQRQIASPPTPKFIEFVPQRMQAITSDTTTHRTISSTDTAIAVYFVGVLLLGARFVRALRRRTRLIASAKPIDVCVPAGGIRLLESGDVVVPVTVGWLHPTILLPRSWRDWDRARFDAVLAHEFAHVRRGDTIVAMLAALNRTLLWFHPAAWWVERQLAAAAEEAADDAALAMIESRESYAEALLYIASALGNRGERVVWSEAAMATSSKVGARIRRLLDDGYRPPSAASVPRRFGFAFACAIALLTASLVTFERRASAQPKPVIMIGTTPDPAMTPELAEKFEEQLRQFPRDLATRTRLINYYHARGFVEGLVHHHTWLITNAPGDLASWQVLRLSSHPQVRSVVAPLWIDAVDTHRDDTRVLWNAATFFDANGDLLRAEEYLKRARLLQPNDPKFSGALISLYGRTIVGLERTSSYFPPQSQDANAFAERAKNDLLGMNDAEVVGGAGVFIATHMRQPLENTTWRDRDLPSRLLARAAQLAPADSRWRRNVVSTPSGARLIDSTPLKPLQMVPPMYPPLAKQARIQGVVRFSVLVAADGAVDHLELVSGHTLLVPAAAEAVKQWKFPAGNGKARTIADVPFELTGAGGTHSAPAFISTLQTLLPSGAAQLVAGESKDVSIELNFDVDSAGVPRNIRVSHPPEVTPFAGEIAKNAEKLRYTPATAAPYPVWIKLTWRNNGGVSLDSNHNALP